MHSLIKHPSDCFYTICFKFEIFENGQLRGHKIIEQAVKHVEKLTKVRFHIHVGHVGLMAENMMHLFFIKRPVALSSPSPDRVVKPKSNTCQERTRKAEAVKLLVNGKNTDDMMAIAKPIEISAQGVNRPSTNPEIPPYTSGLNGGKHICQECGSHNIVFVRERIPVESNIPSSLLSYKILKYLFSNMI